MNTTTRRIVVALLALTASLLIAPANAAPRAAAAAPVGTVSGTVTAADPVPAGRELYVGLYRRTAGGAWEMVAAKRTTVGATYTVSAPTTGSYHVRASVGSTFTSAPSATVSVAKGTKRTGVDVVLEANPTISGTIATEGFDHASLGSRSLRVTAFGRLGGQWEVAARIDPVPWDEEPDVMIRPDGAYTIAVPGFYDAVRLEFSQDMCDLEVVADCEELPAREVQTVFWNGTTYGVYAAADATLLDLSGGSLTGRDITLKKAVQLRATRDAWISGPAVVGSVLTANPGVFVPVAPTAVEYQWFTGGGEYPIPGATGRTFRVREADVDQEISVRATPTRLGYEAPVLLASPRTIRARSAFAYRVKPGKGKATVTIAIKAPGVGQARIHGKASIYAKGKRIKTVNVRNGKATIKVARQKKGKRTYTVRYSGNRVIVSSQKSFKIAIR
ncbi:hypothetical protein IDH50_16110 [Aeromicrobium tamlense]|uniref:Ig-like domain (Group 3) n=1 Tax=Aeromicrobium tamlense TaxID=375541 RepID=A0A8I0FW40_9ACTN|nr:hypothetical protein [Aeromicrobium tamlense]MBD1271770.1 hypothetical protein [Aeromicrobium tamlense]NYI39042.1 hypothetical protein [Aeromicrobium tamlense]